MGKNISEDTMNKQIYNKIEQGFREKCPCCGNCKNYTSEITERTSKYSPHSTYKKEGNKLCSFGGFFVGKSNWCNIHEFKKELTEKDEAILLAWRESIQLPGLYTFDEAQKACPEGYRLPTEEELDWLVDNTKYYFDYEKKEGVFPLPDGFELRLPAVGGRNDDGDFYGQGTLGNYWSSSSSGTDATYVGFGGDTEGVNTVDRVYALSVRCVPTEIEK